MTLDSRQKQSLFVVVLTGLVLVSSLLFYWFFLDRIISDIFYGKSLPSLNRLISPENRSPLSYYQVRAHFLLSHALVLFVSLSLASLALINRSSTFLVIKNFFTETSHPLTLALFRIAVFWGIWYSADVGLVREFSSFPHVLQVAPPGLGWFLAHVPVNPLWGSVALHALVAVCITGILGFFTRTSAFLAAILGFYVLGIPEFYGKVSHYHHLIWFALILAVSRSGDFLSVDAILAGWKRADKGILQPPSPSRVYAIPLRFAMILIGLAYFFPGFWKIWGTGLDWMLGDNLKFQLWLKWSELDGWLPYFRLDQHPLLFRFSATGTVLFELTFVFLIFFPGLRKTAALGGLFFHIVTKVFMQIFFATLVACYVAFFDWINIFNWIGKRLFPQKLVFFYDGNCSFCRRTIATLQSMDILGQIQYSNANHPQQISEATALGIDQESLQRDIHAVIGSHYWIGFNSYRKVAARIPLLWPSLPFLYLPPVPAIGKRIYRHVADSRVCLLPSATQKLAISQETSQNSLKPTFVLGTMLCLIVAICGFTRFSNGWPFACYPTFHFIPDGTRDVLYMTTVNADGREIPWDSTKVSQRIDTDRLRGLLESILKTKNSDLLQTRLHAYLEVCRSIDPSLKNVSHFRFYDVTFRTDPALRFTVPPERRFLFEIDL